MLTLSLIPPCCVSEMLHDECVRERGGEGKRERETERGRVDRGNTEVVEKLVERREEERAVMCPALKLPVYFQSLHQLH